MSDFREKMARHQAMHDIVDDDQYGTDPYLVDEFIHRLDRAGYRRVVADEKTVRLVAQAICVTTNARRKTR